MNPSPQPSPHGASRLTALCDRQGLVLGLFFLLTVGMTWPLAPEFLSSLPAGSGDVRQNFWNFWWWKKCLLELHQHPYWTQYLFFPTGVSLTFYTHSSFNMLLALPVTVVLGPAAAYNFCVLFALTLSGWGAYLLVREITGDSRAGILAGLIFTYFPNHMEQTLEHLNLFSTEFIPLTLFYFLRCCRQGGRKNVILLGVFFAFNTLCSWHLGLKLLLTLVPWAIWQLLRPNRPPKALLRDWLAAALLASVIVLPAVTPLVVEAFSAEEPYYRKPDTNRGIDAAYLLIPPYAQPLLGPLVADAYIDRAYEAAGFLCYLGFVPLGLAVVALWRLASGAVYWTVFALLTLLLAAGSHPFWNGKLYENITLPFALLQQIPVLDLMNVANRFLILTSLALGILAALGWTRLSKKSDVMFLALAGLILFEYLWMPFPMRPTGISPLYESVRNLPPGAVLHIPFHQRSRAADDMMAQTIHERPIGGGYHSTYPPEPQRFIDQDPMLSQLSGVPKLVRPIDGDHLLGLGFSTIVLHKYRMESYREKLLSQIQRTDITGYKFASGRGGVPDETMNQIRAELTAFCGPPASEDDTIVVFDLTRKP
ncbi:MAG: glycosyltransferase family 39 protein [Bryobacterales bacterium]